MQKGFATLEVILVILIISVLMTCAVPNAARIIDKVSLDYETKRLYSDLRFVQALNRSATVTDTGMTNVLNNNKIFPPPVASIVFDNPIENSGGWQIIRGLEDNAPAVREKHILSYGVKISSPSRHINFSFEGESSIISNHLTLKSRRGKESKIIFDSVGRFHGEK